MSTALSATRKPRLELWLALATMVAVALLTPRGLAAFEVHAEFVTYTQIALDLPGVLASHVLDRYYIGRALPSAVAYLLVQALGGKHELGETLRVYAGINLLLVGLAVFSYFRIAERLQFDLREKLFGYVGLFCCFVTLHHLPYVPPTTDNWGILFTLLMLEAHLARKRWPLYLLVAAGAFTWPTIFLGCVLFLLFPLDDGEPQPASRRTRLLAWGCAAGAFLFWLASAGYMLRKGLPTAVIFGVETLPLAPLCMLVVGLYLVPALSLLLQDDRIFNLTARVKQACTLNAVWILLVAAAVTLVKRVSSHAGGQDLRVYWGTHVAQTPLFKPGNFILASILFWGPLFILLMLHWPAVVALLRRTGVALAAYTALGLLTTLHADSRMSLSFVLIPLLFTVKPAVAAARASWSYWTFGLATLLISKVWLELFGLPGGTPADWWWATYGTWMTNRMYVVQGAVVLLLAGLLACAFLPDRWRVSSQRG